MGINQPLPRNVHWDFKIWDPKVPADDHFGDEFGNDLRFHLGKMSKLVVLNGYVVEDENSRRFVKIRLQQSPAAILDNTELSDGIKDLCQNMMSNGREGSREHLNCLTHRSIFGVEPISAAFKAYWTASFFNGILADGPEDVGTLLREIVGEASPYIAPTAMVFAFVALASLTDGFHLMQRLYNQPATPLPELNDITARSLPTVRVLFNYFCIQQSDAGGAADRERTLERLRGDYEQCLSSFKTRYDNVLGDFEQFNAITNGQEHINDSDWMYTVCSHLCDMSQAASELLSLRTDLLDTILSAVGGEQRGAVVSGVFSSVFGCSALQLAADGISTVGSATAVTTGTLATAAIPFATGIAAGAVFAHQGYLAYKRYNKSVELGNEHQRLRNVFAAAAAAWHSGFKIHVLLQRVRLGVQGGAVPFPFSDEETRKKWEAIEKEYQDVTRNMGRLPVVLPLFIAIEVESMKENRRVLE